MNIQKGNALLILVLLIAVAGGGFLLLNKNDDSSDDLVMKEESMMKDKAGEEMMKDIEKEGAMTEEDPVMDGGMEKMEDDSMMMDNEEMKFTGNILAGNKTPLLDFNKIDYDKALKEKALIILYFYANWCPTCKKETAEALYPAFNELNEENIIGFRVNYNDNQTDSDEKALAKEFGVAYQHTKVFLKNGERILKSPESWSMDRYLSEVSNALK